MEHTTRVCYLVSMGLIVSCRVSCNCSLGNAWVKFLQHNWDCGQSLSRSCCLRLTGIPPKGTLSSIRGTFRIMTPKESPKLLAPIFSQFPAKLVFQVSPLFLFFGPPKIFFLNFPSISGFVARIPLQAS